MKVKLMRKCQKCGQSFDAAHIEAIARKAWDSFCHFREVTGKVDTVARFEGYAVKISIKTTPLEHEAKDLDAD